MENRVLVVDDEKSIQKLLSLILEEFQVTEVSSAAEALKIIKNKSCDLVITDLKMPGMSGLELLNEIKKISPEIPVIMISGHGDKNAAIEAINNEVYDFLEKPFDDEVLIHSVKRALKQRNTSTQQSKLIEKLQESETRLRSLSKKIILLQEEERKRIAREIHDELGQLLVVLKIDLSMLKKEHPSLCQNPGETLAQMEETLETSIQSVRKIATNLRPSLLDNLGLTAAMDWQIKEIKKHIDMDIQLKFDLSADTYEPHIATTFFRIFQEGLTNVVKHADASSVHISLLNRNDALTLKIQDNGKGLNSKEIKKNNSFGLIGIQERISDLGGSMEINNTSPAEGVCMTVRLPHGKSTFV
ncbi:MAG: signal transduction histidine kinase [Chlamydiales bacterium]|jgi:signal transduction histidine kinase